LNQQKKLEDEIKTIKKRRIKKTKPKIEEKWNNETIKKKKVPQNQPKIYS
jgi:hypothetical protein